MERYISKLGETGDRAYWEKELDAFWKLFAIEEGSKTRGSRACEYKRLPNRPQDAWDRWAKTLGLQLIVD